MARPIGQSGGEPPSLSAIDERCALPFAASAARVFRAAAKLEVQAGAIGPCLVGPKAERDVSAIIGLSGDVVGLVMMSFPDRTAERIVAAFAGKTLAAGTADFADALGELANMVAGNAKSHLIGRNITISCATVITGNAHHVRPPSGALCVRIPFASAAGSFSVELVLKDGRKSFRAA